MAGEQVVTLKSAPEDSVRYQRTFSSITPGYHMTKRHWITVRTAEELDATLIGELVTDSYLLVVEKLPRTQRPVGAARFGPTRPGHRQLQGEEQGISL